MTHPTTHPATVRTSHRRGHRRHAVPRLARAASFALRALCVAGGLAGPALQVQAQAQAQAQAQSPASAPPARSFPPLRAGTTAPRVAVPAVELFVDWRIARADEAPAAGGADAAGPGAGLVVGTRAPVPPGWTATRSRDAAPPAAVTTVRVMNGHEASWRVDDAHVRPDYDFVWTAQGQGIVSHDTVVHAARSLQATPRWPGGSAPVQLALAVSASRPRGLAPQDADREAALQTIVSLAFDEWVAVARLGDDEVQVRVRRR